MAKTHLLIGSANGDADHPGHPFWSLNGCHSAASFAQDHIHTTRSTITYDVMGTMKGDKTCIERAIRRKVENHERLRCYLRIVDRPTSCLECAAAGRLKGIRHAQLL